MQLYKDLVVSGSSRLTYFKTFSYGLSLGGCVLLVLAAAYFGRESRRVAAA
jgi:hypothetical protein